MDERLEQIDKLSPAKQRLLEQMRMKKGGVLRKAKTRPLSYEQFRLWLLDQKEPGNPAYNIHFNIRLKGELNRDALERSLNEIVNRHEALRTRFIVEEGGPVQQIVAKLKVGIQDIRPAGATHIEREAEARRLAHEEVLRPFDFSLAPLLRVKLVVIDPGDQVLMLTMHHLVGDGWSTKILAEELNALYAAYTNGQPSPLQPLLIQYGDFTAWQKDWLQGAVLEKQLGYWRKQLENAHVLEISGFMPSSVISNRAGRYIFPLSGELSCRLKEMGQRHGCTLFMVLLAGFQLLLSRYSGQTDIIVGTPIANRNYPETEKLIGFFANTLALRAVVRESSTLLEFLQQVREITLGAYDHQDMPFGRLVELLAPDRVFHRNQLFQMMFAVQYSDPRDLQLPGLQLSRFVGRVVLAKYDLKVSFREQASGIEGSLLYASDLYDFPMMERFARHLQAVLEKIAYAPESQVGDISFPSEAERLQIEMEWSRTYTKL